MGKIKDSIDTAGLRMGNTITTPFRLVGETWNALGNVLRQGKSSIKNTAEVGKQTIDALLDNFLNFSKVEGKGLKRVLKGGVNLVSAVTRRPWFIAGSGVLSALNQGIRKPFTKLAPGKRFKGMMNATRLFSKKKGFDFAQYDTHETGKDTRVNSWKEKRHWFIGAKKWSEEKWWSPEKKAEKKVEEAIKEEKEEKWEQKPETKAETKPATPVAAAPTASKPSEGWASKPQAAWEKKDDTKKDDASKEKPSDTKVTGKEKSIGEIEKKNKANAEAKDKAENAKKERKNLDRKEKGRQEKEIKKILDDDATEEGVLARGKKNKKWENIDQILATLKKENITMAGYIEDEILAKKESAKAKAA